MNINIYEIIDVLLESRVSEFTIQSNYPSYANSPSNLDNITKLRLDIGLPDNEKIENLTLDLVDGDYAFMLLQKGGGLAGSKKYRFATFDFVYISPKLDQPLTALIMLSIRYEDLLDDEAW